MADSENKFEHLEANSSSLSGLNPLQYRKLDASNGRQPFRLIHILPGEFSRLVECYLNHYTLDECPEYECLSYCWGLSTDRVPVVCNEAALHITPSLESALHYLRDENDPRTIWIDQIAINQADMEERTQQVRIMRTIYENAVRTIAWLGEPTADSDLAIEYCKRVLTTMFTDEEFRNQVNEGTAGKRPDPYGGLIKAEFAKTITREEEVALARLLKRPYFSRMWIIQEVGIPREVILLSGRKSISFDSLYSAFGITILISKGVTFGRPLWIHNLDLLSTVRCWRDGDVGALDITELLQRARQCKATDPRDNLFALYGVTLTDLSLIELTADYHSSTTDVYRDAAFKLLCGSGRLDILETPRGHSDLRTSLPSWVPDWSDNSVLPVSLTHRYEERIALSKTQMRPLMMDAIKAKGLSDEDIAEVDIEALLSETEKELREEDDQFVRTNVKFCAAASSLCPPPSLGGDGRSLITSGHIIDKVSVIGQKLEAPEFDQEKFDTKVAEATEFSLNMKSAGVFLSKMRQYVRTLVEWEDIATKNQPEKYVNGELRKTVYWKVLCGGYVPDGEEESQNGFKELKSQLRGAMAIQKLNPRNRDSPGILTMLSLFFGGTYTALRGKHPRKFATLMEVSLERKLMRTSKGYLGLAPANTKEGDIIAILKGRRMPFVMRSRGGPWELIGPCYLHGVMHGEAFDEDSCSEVRIV